MIALTSLMYRFTKEQTWCRLETHFFDMQAANGLLAAKKIKMHDPNLTYNHISDDSLLWCMHEAAVKHGPLSNSLISSQRQKLIVFEPLWYDRYWPRSQSELEKRMLLDVQTTVELVDFVRPGIKTPWLVLLVQSCHIIPCTSTCQVYITIIYQSRY